MMTVTVFYSWGGVSKVKIRRSPVFHAQISTSDRKLWDNASMFSTQGGQDSQTQKYIGSSMANNSYIVVRMKNV